MRKRDNRIVENVDFEKLRECLKKHGIKQKELSIVCGYYPDYIKKNTLRKHYMTQHVRDVLTYAYKVDPSEYIDTQPKEVINPVDAQPKYYKFDPSEYFDTQQKEVANTEDDDMYTLILSFNGKLLKKMALKSIEENITVQDFVFNCIIKGIGDKILEESEK